MGKPSIFSKEYEKKMKRRRRNIIFFALAIILVISSLVVKIMYNPIDYSNIRKNIQAWIDSDTTNMEQKANTNKEEVADKVKKEEATKEMQKPVEEYMNITLISGSEAKAVYTDDGKGGKVFKTLNTSDAGVSFDISPLGKEMIVMDTDLTITQYNVDGTSKIVSKDQYVSTSGSVFPKTAIIQSNPAYLWNASPKFVGEDKMIFITNRPYFGNGTLKKYIWMTDTTNGADKTFWDLAGQNIEIGAKEEKGIKIIVDGQIHYIDVNGNIVQ